MKTVQNVRQLTSLASTYVGALGQFIMDLGLNVIRVHDGATPGGFVTMSGANNLADLSDIASARDNLDLGSAAVADTTDFDASGAAAAVQANLNAVNVALTADIAAITYYGKFNSSGVTVIDTGISVNAGQPGLCLIALGTTQNGAGNNTGAFVYMLRFKYDGGAAPAVTTIVADAGGTGTGGLTFGVSGGHLTVQGPGTTNWGVALYGSK